MTISTKPSIIVRYPPSAHSVAPTIGYSTIRNTPEAVWRYVFAVAPGVYAEACRLRKVAKKNGWTYDEARTRTGAMLVIEGKCHEHEEPLPVRIRAPFFIPEWHYELAQVDGYSVRAFSTTKRSMLYCTCHDASAPRSFRADYTCEHILAWALMPESD